jgi:hypothetical protein
MGQHLVDYRLFTTVRSGEIAGATSATQMPNIPADSGAILLQAPASNVGNVYVGGAGVTKPDGSTDTTTGLEMTPGAMLQFMPCSNLNIYYYICDNVGDDILYMVLQ